MKIAYLHYLFGRQAGRHHVRQFAQAVRRLGHQLEEYAMHPEAADPAGTSSGVRRSGRGRRVLKRLLGRYLHEPKELLMTIPYTARELALLRRDRPDVVLVRTSLLNASAVLAARRLDLPLVIEVNAPPEEPRLYYHQYWHLPWLPERVEYWKMRRADGLVVVSSWIRSYLVERVGLPAHTITVAPNGADVEVFHPGLERDPDLPEAFATAPVVGFVGSFLPWHGSLVLGRMALSVASSEPDVRFLFVGEGPGLEELRRMVRPLGEQVLFTGWVPHERVPGLLATFDVAVMPGANPYSSPLKVIEWMAAGKAVVAPRTGPLEEVIRDGVEGRLFTPGDEEALAAEVRHLVRAAELRQSLGQAAGARVRDSLSWEHNARRVLEACEAARARHHDAQP